jgi:hypothetical protein
MVAIKSIKYLACSDASVSLYGTLPGMEVDDIHAFVDTCLKSIVTDKECMNVLVRPLRLSHYSFPPSTQGTLAETALIDAFRQWFRSLNA